MSSKLTIANLDNFGTELTEEEMEAVVGGTCYLPDGSLLLDEPFWTVEENAFDCELNWGGTYVLE